jgi:hypothetical protein
MGDKLSDSFEKKWASSEIETRLKEEKAIKAREDLELAEVEAKIPGRTGNSKAHAEKLRKLNTELAAELSSKPAAETSSKDGQMSFEQKRRLSVALGMLPGNKLQRVLEIVAECPTINYEGDDEIELDIDTLDQATLKKLQRYVDSIAPTHSVPQKTTNKTTSAGVGR